MKKFIERIKVYSLGIYNGALRSRSVRKLLIWSKRLRLPGFDKVPLYDVIDFFIKGIQKGAITNRAAALSFNFFLAIFPAIIFFFSLIPYIPIDNFQDSLLNLLEDFIPNQAYAAVEDTLFDIVKRPRGNLLSIGFIMAMFFATNSITSLMEAFNQTFYSIETRSAFRQRLVAIGLVFLLSFLVVIAIALITVGPVVLNWLQTHNLLTDKLTLFMLSAGKWLITLALLFFAFSTLYYFGPSRKMKFRFISAGSTLTTLLFIAASVGFNFYVNNFARYNSLYGSIGTLIIFMLWIYFNAIIILVGFELNASISAARKNNIKSNNPEGPLKIKPPDFQNI
ncbi:MAG: YihY/virulence factor BrkB family protein [Bacteroidetes bacterium HGW-Bacteroidetes-11]|jgi:membrane protein|nr:MAG: YihY/virulence factor BrkB family protein [Bacteroidetes bacterium HGW-Bacteroidetes-11]